MAIPRDYNLPVTESEYAALVAADQVTRNILADATYQITARDREVRSRAEAAMKSAKDRMDAWHRKWEQAVTPQAKAVVEAQAEQEEARLRTYRVVVPKNQKANHERTRFSASDIDLKPTEQMASNAARGLELREKHGKGGTAVGVARARDIKNRANLSPSTVRRMHSFFSRHEGNQKGGEDDAGYIAWLLWGGDAGKAWAARKSEQLDKSESARFAAHGVRLPSRKGRLNIDAAMAALQQMGYHLQFNTVRYDSSHHPHWKVTQPNGSVVEMSGQQITDLVYQKGEHMKIGTKAAFAINPVVMESLKSHASKMSDLLRQFIAEANKSLGNRMDAAWLAQQRATVEGAIRELNNGRVAASVNMAREWADEFAQTYLHHEHTRQLAWIARAIAREPAHVAELAKAHNVPMSRAGAKVKFAATVAGAAAYTKNLVKSLGFYPDAVRFDTARNLLVLEFTSAPIIAMNCATKLHYELSKRGFGLHRVSVNNGMESRGGEDVGVVTISLDDVAAKGLNSRAGAKSKFAESKSFRDLVAYARFKFNVNAYQAQDIAGRAGIAMQMHPNKPMEQAMEEAYRQSMAILGAAQRAPEYTVGGGTGRRDPSLVNSRAGAKATMAKFKVGDRIAYKPFPPTTAGEIVEIREPTVVGDVQRRGQLDTLERQYKVRKENGSVYWVNEGDAIKASRAGAKSTHALPVPTIANPLNRTEHHGDAIAAINAAIKSGNANEARRLFNLYAHTLNSTEKAGVWGIIRKMIGPQFSRAGAKAAMNRTEEEFAEDVQNAAALIASWAKALQTALGLRDYARAKFVVAQIANTATSLSSELKNPATRMSRAGAKSTHATDNMYYTVAAHIGDQPAGERTTKSLDEAKAYAKSMLAALKPNAKGKPLVVDVYPVVNYSPQAPVLSLKASRAGAKSDGLTLAQRIAVEHDAKRMAAR